MAPRVIFRFHIGKRSMTYFLYSGEIEEDMEFTIQGEEAFHILLSRRIKKDQEIIIQDQNFHRFKVKVVDKKRKSLDLLPLTRLRTPPEPDFKIHLYQSIVKEKAMDHIIQKSTELGVASLTLFHSDFSQNSDLGSEKKMVRWQRISWEACKQSGRLKPPEMRLIPLGTAPPMDKRKTLFLSLGKKSVSLRGLRFKEREINIMIGPEGGWSEREIAECDHQTFHLGPRTLRSDTASLVALSILQCNFGDFSIQPVNI